MSQSPPRQHRRRRASIAGLLALIAAVAVATAWFQEESRSSHRWAVVMLAGFALAGAVVSLSSPSLTAASIRLAVGSALLLVSVAWARTRAESVGWQYGSVFHWAAYWALATVVLPILAGPGLRRIWMASGRQAWVGHLRQVPGGFVFYILTVLLSLLIGGVLDALNPPPPAWVGRMGPKRFGSSLSAPAGPRPGRGVAPVSPRPPASPGY